MKPSVLTYAIVVNGRHGGGKDSTKKSPNRFACVIFATVRGGITLCGRLALTVDDIDTAYGGIEPALDDVDALTGVGTRCSARYSM
jgi:hypothetical protein